MGNFRMNLGDDLAKALPRSYSATMDDQLPILSPSEMARQEMYTQVPFVAMYGLQKKEREVANTFANYAADLDVAQMRGLSDEDKSMRHASSSMLILDEMEDAKVVTAPLIFTVIVVSASMFSVGYNTSVMNAPEKIVFPGHSITSWALAVAAFAIGGPFGSASGGKLADKRGRRGAMLVGIWIFLLGGLLQSGKRFEIHLPLACKSKNILRTHKYYITCFVCSLTLRRFFDTFLVAQDMLTIILARFIIGFASGYTTVLVPIYLGEVAPPSLRGTLGTLTQFAMVIGILFADLVAFPLATPSGWRFMFSITDIIAIGQLLLSPFLLESPRWLLNRNPQSLRARYIIKKLRGLRNEHEVEREVGNFIIGESAQHHDENQKGDVLKELMSHSRRRKLLISCLILQMAQQLSGINAVFFYSTAILEGVIDNPLVGTTVIGAVK